jgi:hypothetical protein
VLNAMFGSIERWVGILSVLFHCHQFPDSTGPRKIGPDFDPVSPKLKSSRFDRIRIHHAKEYRWGVHSVDQGDRDQRYFNQKMFTNMRYQKNYF